MLSYEDHIGKKAPDWPYEVNYGKENEISADVLIVGEELPVVTQPSLRQKKELRLQLSTRHQ